MRLSVLDLSPVPAGTSSGDALHNTIDLARKAEELGCHRYWLAEHHNAASLASSSPEVMIATVLAATSRLRVGSGGIMLPNHATLKVAETFRALHALHPGRVDLGVGRAAGTDKKTALALRRSSEHLGAEGFPAQLEELLAFLARDPDPGTPFGPIKAVPTGVPPPELWVLGSGVDGAALAARFGLAFAFAHHFNPEDATDALDAYRAGFQPSCFLDAPRALVATSAIAADSDADADRLASSGGLAWLRFGRGLRDLPFPTVEEALAYPYDAEELEIIRAGRARGFCGSAERVVDGLVALARDTGVSEIMITTHVHEHAERRRSYERIARALARRS